MACSRRAKCVAKYAFSAIMFWMVFEMMRTLFYFAKFINDIRRSDVVHEGVPSLSQTTVLLAAAMSPPKLQTSAKYAARCDAKFPLEQTLVDSLVQYQQRDRVYNMSQMFGRVSLLYNESVPCFRKQPCSAAEKRADPLACAWMGAHRTCAFAQIIKNKVKVRVRQTADSSDQEFKTFFNVDRLQAWVAEIQEVASRVALPDSQFFIFLGDGCPVEFWDRLGSEGPLPPILCAEMQKKDAMNRQFTPFFAPPRSMFKSWGWDENLKTIANKDRSRWADKIPKAVFRGASTGMDDSTPDWRKATRPALAMLSRDHPDLIDAGLTSIVQIQKNSTLEEIRAFGLATYMSMEEQANHKIIIVPDGNTAADRLPSHMLHNVAIAKPSSEHTEFWYDEIKPWVHYIPSKSDLSDFVENIKTALSNDTRLRGIAVDSSKFVKNKLTRGRLNCYWYRLLRELGELQGKSGSKVVFMEEESTCSAPFGV